jgi:hypothetical protein
VFESVVTIAFYSEMHKKNIYFFKLFLILEQ